MSAVKKKNNGPSAAGSDKPGTSTPVSSKQAKNTDPSGAVFATPKRPAPSSKDGSTSKQNLHKTFLSKSQDNLASQLRRKAVAAALKGKDKETPGAKEKSSASSSSGSTASPAPSRGGSAGPGGKQPKTPGSTTASHHHHHHKGPHATGDDTPIKRAQSAQNVSKPQPNKVDKSSANVKRASSTQNISGKNGAPGRQVRISAPSVNIMAYNAELLASFEKEKKALERRISELIQVAENRKTEIEKYKFEVKNLKEQISNEPNMQEKMEMIQHENQMLKEKLKEMGVSVEEQITDSEKLSMLHKGGAGGSGLRLSDQDSRGATGGGGGGPGKRKKEKIPDFNSHGDPILTSGGNLGSIDAELGLSVGDLSCITPEHPSSLDNSNWDRLSNKSSDGMSEVSVACLQDRIIQMEETHYSTSEELQATLQELGDLQDAVNHLSDENEGLATERQVLLESLCAQTEKLENARMQIDHLKALLVSESEGGDRSENERQLVALLKSAQEEREELLLKQIELSNSLQAMENEVREQSDIITALRDKSQILEMKNESLLGDKRASETQTSELKEQTAKDQIEIQRLKTLYENEKATVAELEKSRNVSDKSDLEELLDNTRHEKADVETKLTNTQEELAMCQNEISKLRDNVSSLAEELKVVKNNAKSQVGDLEYKLEQVESEKSEVTSEMDTLRDHIDQLQLDCDRYLEEKKSHASTVATLETDVRTYKKKYTDLEAELNNEKHKFGDELNEWRQFQADLQTAVVIANDFKMEAQESIEKYVAENTLLKERNHTLAEEISKLHDEITKSQKEREKIDLRGRVITTMDRELSALRTGRKLSDRQGNENLSVKNLIASIEHQVKTVGTPPLSPSTLTSQNTSRRSSIDSTHSGRSLGGGDSPTKADPNLDVGRRSSVPADMHLKLLRKPNGESKDARQPLAHRHGVTNIIYEKAPPMKEETRLSPPGGGGGKPDNTDGKTKSALKGILTDKSSTRKNSNNAPEQMTEKSVSHGSHVIKSDPLAYLAKQMGGSKRNALLKWCQNKLQNYPSIDITNFSSSWNDGLAFCALMHLYLPDKIPYKELNTQDKRRNFSLAFKAAESVGIESILEVNDMVAMERPDWQAVMSYITSVYKHFELDVKS